MSDNLGDLLDEVDPTGRGTVSLRLETDSEWRVEIDALPVDGRTVRGALSADECMTRIEELKSRQAKKGKSVEGVYLNVRHEDGSTNSYDDIKDAYDVALQPGDQLHVGFKIGNNA